MSPATEETPLVPNPEETPLIPDGLTIKAEDGNKGIFHLPRSLLLLAMACLVTMAVFGAQMARSGSSSKTVANLSVEASLMSINKKVVDLGDNPDVLLKECEGDCDWYEDCEGDLECFERSYDTEIGLAEDAKIPGCNQWGDIKDNDYCVKPTGDIPLFGGSLNPTYKLDECQGDCDYDTDCKPGLKCMQRNRNGFVPGCKGPGHTGWDYCYDPIKIYHSWYKGSGSSSSVLCPGQHWQDFCDCDGDCFEQPQWCQCADAKECCGGGGDGYDNLNGGDDYNNPTPGDGYIDPTTGDFYYNPIEGLLPDSN